LNTEARLPAGAYTATTPMMPTATSTPPPMKRIRKDRRSLSATTAASHGVCGALSAQWLRRVGSD
jgi:hypothetical protein